MAERGLEIRSTVLGARHVETGAALGLLASVLLQLARSGADPGWLIGHASDQSTWLGGNESNSSSQERQAWPKRSGASCRSRQWGEGSWVLAEEGAG